MCPNLPGADAVSVSVKIGHDHGNGLLTLFAGELSVRALFVVEAEETDPVARLSPLWRSHELNLGVVVIAGAQDHAVRRVASKRLDLHVSQNQDHGAFELFLLDEGPQSGSDLAYLTLTAVDFFAIQSAQKSERMEAAYIHENSRRIYEKGGQAQ